MTRRRLAVVTCIAAVLAAAAFGRAAPAQTVDELVARNIQAKGGLEKLQAVQAIRQTSRMSMQGMEAELVVYGKRPNLIRQEIRLGPQVVVNAFDGVTPWMINPLVSGSTTPVAVTGPEAELIREQSHFDGPLVDYKARGAMLELVGSEEMAGRPVHHLKMTSKAGQVQHVYLDAATGLESKVVIEGPTGSLEQELLDYRDVDGLQVPFFIKTSANGMPLGQITVTAVELNPRIDDAIFRMGGR